MVFSSAIFLYVYAPVFFVFYYISPKNFRGSLILLGSLVFYTAGAGPIVIVLLFSVWINHFLALRIDQPARGDRRRLLTFGISINLAGLAYFKYADFLWRLTDHMLHAMASITIGSAPGIQLPIGISFFTFQAISYLVDVYRREVPPAATYHGFAVYHTLFPQLVAGPIVRYREVRRDLERPQIDLAAMTEGAYRFCLGFGKKMILADNLGRVTDHILNLSAPQITFGHAWLAMICYSLQIYYDFSGYSDMAIGLGRLLGLGFPENFNQPYRSANITEFWRRWHMTLTRWFRDYVYIPLGGNRRGPWRTYRNLWTVFFLCGLWHGAGINFVFWGLYHGGLLVVERFLHQHFRWRASGIPGVALCFALVTIGWVPFRIDDPGAAITLLRTMFLGGSAGPVDYPLSYYLSRDVVFYLAVALTFAFIPMDRVRHLRFDRITLLAGQLGFGLLNFAYAVVQLAANSFNPFIYFRF
jgi:alginate O-acetyltransferase complex protein AlgI